MRSRPARDTARSAGSPSRATAANQTSSPAGDQPEPETASHPVDSTVFFRDRSTTATVDRPSVNATRSPRGESRIQFRLLVES
jgi:hypothetical protein